MEEHRLDGTVLYCRFAAKFSIAVQYRVKIWTRNPYSRSVDTLLHSCEIYDASLELVQLLVALHLEAMEVTDNTDKTPLHGADLIVASSRSESREKRVACLTASITRNEMAKAAGDRSRISHGTRWRNQLGTGVG